MGLIKTAAKVAVASAVHGRVQRRQQQRWATQEVQSPPSATPSSIPSADAQPSDRLERLKLLGELRAGGVLSDAEFEQEKAKILAAG